MEHVGVLETQSESDLLALRRLLEAGTIHWASVCAVWLIVPLHCEVHSGIPFLMYASCNKCIWHDMQDMLHHICTTWAPSSELYARGYLLSPGIAGDPRRAAAHRGSMQLSQTMELPGVDCNVACWGGGGVGPPHLFKNNRSHGLNHGV